MKKARKMISILTAVLMLLSCGILSAAWGEAAEAGETEAAVVETEVKAAPEKAEEKPAEQPAEKKEKKAEKAEEKPAEQPAEKKEKKAEKAEEKPAEKPAEKAEEKPAEQPAQEPEEKPAEQPAEKPEEKPAGQPAQEPEEKPAEEPAQEPEEKPAEEPAQEAGEPEAKPETAGSKPAENAEEKPAEKPAPVLKVTVKADCGTRSVPLGAEVTLRAEVEGADDYEIRWEARELSWRRSQNAEEAEKAWTKVSTAKRYTFTVSESDAALEFRAVINNGEAVSDGYTLPAIEKPGEKAEEPAEEPEAAEEPAEQTEEPAGEPEAAEEPAGQTEEPAGEPEAAEEPAEETEEPAEPAEETEEPEAAAEEPEQPAAKPEKTAVKTEEPAAQPEEEKPAEPKPAKQKAEVVVGAAEEEPVEIEDYETPLDSGVHYVYERNEDGSLKLDADGNPVAILEEGQNIPKTWLRDENGALILDADGNPVATQSVPADSVYVQTLRDQLNPDRSIDIYVAFADDDPVLGGTACFFAVLNGYDTVEYSLQWQESADGVHWDDLSAANQNRLEVVTSEENRNNYWRVEVTITSVQG